MFNNIQIIVQPSRGLSATAELLVVIPWGECSWRLVVEASRLPWKHTQQLKLRWAESTSDDRRRLMRQLQWLWQEMRRLHRATTRWRLAKTMCSRWPTTPTRRLLCSSISSRCRPLPPTSRPLPSATVVTPYRQLYNSARCSRTHTLPVPLLMHSGDDNR